MLDLDATVGANMPKLAPTFGEDPANQQAAVAVRRVLLAAEHRDPVAPHPGDQSIEPAQEPWRAGDQVVADVALLVVEHVLGRPPAELGAQEHVANPGCRQRSFEWRPVELRRVPGAGNRSNVCDHIDRVLSQQTDQAVDVVIGMADAEDRPRCACLPRGIRHVASV